MVAWDKDARDAAIKKYQDSKTNSDVYDQFGHPRWLSPTFGKKTLYDDLLDLQQSIISLFGVEDNNMTDDDPIIMLPVKRSVVEQLVKWNTEDENLGYETEMYLQEQAISVLPIKTGTLEFPVDIIHSIADASWLLDTEYAVAVEICRDWVELESRT